MKTIYLVRHAKSDKGNPHINDVDRPLNQRGYRDAYFMSGLMQKQKQIPDIILTSPALRAYSTALIFLKAFKMETGKLHITERLYKAGGNAYIDELKLVKNNYKSVMLFAHNPDIIGTANILSNKKTNDFPTCGILCLDFNVDHWTKISKGKQRFFEYPEK